MKGRKANLAFAAALFSALILIFAAVLIIQPEGAITGATVYQPAVPAYCITGNDLSCVNLNGDNVIDGDDEDIFAQILNGVITDYELINMADFDGNGTVDNAVDFQMCFVPLRDYYQDIHGGQAFCNLPKGDFGEPDFSNCLQGCPDLNGDGYVNDDDFEIFGGFFYTDGDGYLQVNNTFLEYYPGADMADPEGVGMEDKDCMSIFSGRIVTCNMPVHLLHTQGCPDLTGESDTGNDGYVNADDQALFDSYKSSQNLKADFDNDGDVDWLDEHIFNQYMNKVVDCDLYHAAWHIGGINKENIALDSTYSEFGGSYNLSQSFVAGYDGQLTKVRLYLKNQSSNLKPVVVDLYPANFTSDKGPNQTYSIATTSITPSFELNSSSWITIPFDNPPVLEANHTYHIVVGSPESGDNEYIWYYNNVTEKNASTADASWHNESSNSSEAGYAIAAGDINNDGYGDIIIADPFYDTSEDNSTNEGKVYLFYGPVSGTGIDLSNANASWYGDSTIDQLGMGVATGDINNDGYDDILMGAPYNDAVGTNTGSVYILYGPVSDGNHNITSSYDAIWHGETSSDGVGRYIAAGDINNDGYDDIFISNIYYNDSSHLEQGMVYVLYGPAGYGGPHDLSTAADIKIAGDKNLSYIGTSLAIGDINSDNYGDLIIGAKDYDSSNSNDNKGAVFVFNGPLPSEDEINTSIADAAWIGEDSSDYAGNSVATADINNDGYDDIVIGAYYAGVSAKGKVYLVYGPTSGTQGLSSADAIWTAGTGGEYLGSSVATADINNDGYDDVLIQDYGYNVGGITDTGASYVIYGPVASGTKSIESAWGTKWHGDSSSSHFGGQYSSTPVATADINNDGYDDAIIGSPDAGSHFGGKAYLFYGPFTIDVNGSYWNQTSYSGWTKNEDKDFLFQLWMSAACADLDADGGVNTSDDTLILEIPDQLRYSGTPGWDTDYDLDGDGRITSNDTSMLSYYRNNEQINITEDVKCTGDVGNASFGWNVTLAQPFRPEIDKIYYVGLYLKLASGSGTKNITVEIREEGESGPDMVSAALASTQIVPVTDHSDYQEYRAFFGSSPASIIIDGKYYIVVSSPTSFKTDEYHWRKCGDSPVPPDDQKTARIVMNLTNNTVISITLVNSNTSFIVYEGNNDSINTTLDVNDDLRVDTTDYNLVHNAEGNWSGGRWSSKVDFNAEFGVYEKLKDYTLGFKAYLNKVATCSLPNWPKGAGNRRCDVEWPYNETYEDERGDCSPCDYNGFCAVSEDFTHCPDCLWSAETPLYDNFKCNTTDFLNESQYGDLSSISNAVIENCNSGKIRLYGTSNFTGLGLDNDITMRYGYLGIISPTLDAINITADIYLYNLTFTYPLLLHDGDLCLESRCMNINYTEKSSGKSDFKFSVPSIGTYKYWRIETVESNSDVGTYSSIDLGDYGRPHISYYNATGGDLKYAKWTGSEWETSTIDSPPATDVGQHTSIVIDSKNQPHISYYDTTNYDLKYATYNGLSWDIETIDSSNDVGWYTSIALDSNNNPHISYWNATGGDLKYAYYNESNWYTKTIDIGINTGIYTSIALDSNNNPHISYYDNTNYDLKYAYYNGTDWNIEIVESNNEVGKYTSIALDSNNNPHISYNNDTDGDLKYAHYNGTDWITETLDITGSVGAYTSIALDSNNNPHISYYDTTNSNLKYAYYNGASWHNEAVDSGSVGSHNSIALDKYDNVYISYYNSTGADLKIAALLSATNYSLIEAAPYIEGFNGSSTTDFGFNTGINLNNVSNFTLENEYGKIKFLETVNLSPINLTRVNITANLNITSNSFIINLTALPMLNVSAEVTLSGIDYVYPYVFQNHTFCRNWTPISQTSGNFTFKLNEFNDSIPLSYYVVDLAPDVTAFEPVQPTGTTTNFSLFPNFYDITDYTGAILKNDYGMVQFTDAADYSFLNLSRYINITHNNFTINISGGNMSRLNISSDITLFNLSFVYPEVVYSSGTECGLCTYLSYVGDTNLLFNVSYFNNSLTSFKARELAPDVSAFNSSGFGSYSDFSINNNYDIANVSGIYLKNNNKGKVDFFGAINATILNFSEHVVIDYRSLSINVSNISVVSNISANITFYNASLAYPIIERNSTRCPGDVCSFLYYEADTDLKFRVSGFEALPLTSYSLREGAPNVSLFNGSLTTNFSRIGTAEFDFDIENVSGIVLEKEEFGKIEFLEPLNVSAGNLSWGENIDITNGGTTKYIFINRTELSNLINKSADITFYNLSLVDPIIRYRNTSQQLDECPDSVCAIVSYPSPSQTCKTTGDCTLVFNITHFMNDTYWAMEESTGPQFIYEVDDQQWYENNNQTIENLSSYVFDPDNDTLLYNVTTDCSRINATVNLTTTDVIFNPSTDWTGSCTATLNISDGNSSISQNITLSVIENIPPQFIHGPIVIDAWDEDTNKSVDIGYFFWDPDGDELYYNYTLLVSDSNITIIINQTTGNFTFAPAANWYGSNYIRFSAEDEKAKIYSSPYTTLTVNSVNDIPSLLKNFPNNTQTYFTIYEDENFTINLSEHFNDVEDGKELFYHLDNASSGFNILFNQSEHTVFFAPLPNWNGYDDFIIIANDTDGGSKESNEFIVYVTAVADPVEVLNDSVYLLLQEETMMAVELTDWLHDPDNDSMFFYTSMTYPSYLVVNLNPYTGQANITPSENFIGSELINFSATDGLSIGFTIVNITINNSDDPPYLNESIPTFAWAEDTTNISLNLSKYFVEPDEQALTYSVITEPLNINSTINQTSGIVTLVPEANWSGTNTIKFMAEDPNNNTADSNNITLNVTPVNDPPHVTADIPNKAWVRDSNITINLDNYFDDIDSDVINYTAINGTKISVSIDQETKISTIVSDTGWNGTSWVIFTANDTLLRTNSTNITLTVMVGLSWLTDTRIDGVQYPNGNYTNLTNIIISNLTNTNTTNTSSFFNSTIYNSEILNSTLDYCQVNDSEIINTTLINCNVTDSFVKNYVGSDCVIEDSIVDPPAGQSNITGSTIIGGSKLYNSNVTYSHTSNSNITNSDGTNCTIENSDIVNSHFANCTIINGTITEGKITYPNRTYYDTDADGDKNLTDIINYLPAAGFTASTTSPETNQNITFNSTSTDKNVPGEIDNLTYSWYFDEEGLISYWKFDGDADDYLGANNGTITGAVFNASGKHSGAYEFDGSDDHINMGDIGSSLEYTASFWFKSPDTINPTHPQIASETTTLLSKTDISGEVDMWVVNFLGWGDARMALSNEYIQSTYSRVNSTTDVWNADQWYHIAAVSNGTDAWIYVDGELENTTSGNFSGGAWSNSGNIQLGIDYKKDADRYFKGKIDDVRIYNRSLSADEIMKIYETNISSPDLVYYYASDGTYDVELLVKDNFNETSAATQTITVGAPEQPGDGGGGRRGGGRAAACTEHWNCTEFGDCTPSGLEYRTCVDVNLCGTYVFKPVENQVCDYTPTCTDFVLNQDESDVDCGGSCPPCVDGRICIVEEDCQNSCIENVCATPTEPAITTAAPARPLPPPPPVQRPAPVSFFDKQIFGISIIVYLIAILVGVVLLGGGAFILTHKGKAPVQPYSTLDSLKTAIKRDIIRGVPEESIRKALLGMGWSTYIVDQAIEEINKSIIKHSTENYITRGYNEVKLKKALVKKGWPSSIVDDVIEDVNISILKRTMNQNLAKGFNAEDIKNDMVKKGWPEDFVERAADEINNK